MGSHANSIIRFIIYTYYEGKAGELVYISDVKIVPPDTMAYLKSITKIKVLVLDALNLDTGVWSHMGLTEALQFARELQPDTVYFIGWRFLLILLLILLLLLMDSHDIFHL